MSQIRTSMVIDLVGNLQARAQQFQRSLHSLGAGGSRSLQVLSRSVSTVSHGLDRIGNRYTAFLTGAAGLGAVRSVGNLSERLTMLGINAEMSREKINQLYTKILNMAQAPDIRVDPSQILSGVEKIVSQLGNLDVAEENIRNIALAIRATGSEGENIGNIISNLYRGFNIKSPDDILLVLDKWIRQAHAASFEVKDFATQANGMIATYGSMGASGMKAANSLGAVAQVFFRSTRSPEEVSTAWKNLFSDLIQKEDKLAKLTVKGKKAPVIIWEIDPKTGKKTNVIRDVIELIDEILRKSGGNMSKLAEVFGMQTLDGMRAFINEYNQTGRNAAIQYRDLVADGSQITKDAATAAKEFNAAMQHLNTSWQRFANAQLSEPVQRLADALNSLGDDTVQRWLNMGMHLGMIVGTLILANKVAKGLAWIVGGLKFLGLASAAGSGAGATVGIPLGAGYLLNEENRKALKELSDEQLDVEIKRLRDLPSADPLSDLWLQVPYLQEKEERKRKNDPAYAEYIDAVLRGPEKELRKDQARYFSEEYLQNLRARQLQVPRGRSILLDQIIDQNPAMRDQERSKGGIGTSYANRIDSILDDRADKLLGKDQARYFSDEHLQSLLMQVLESLLRQQGLLERTSERLIDQRVDINLKVDAEGRSVVKSMKTDSRNVQVDVSSGLYMVGP